MDGILAINRDLQCSESNGGASELYVFEYKKYARSLINVTDNILVNFPYSVIYNLNAKEINFTENIEEEDGGVAFSQNGSFQISFIKPSDNYKKFTQMDWRIILRDNNGYYRLIGLENGVKIKYNKEIGSNLGDFNGFRFSFETKEEYTAPFMNDLIGFFIDEYPNLADQNGNTIIDNNSNNIEAVI